MSYCSDRLHLIVFLVWPRLATLSSLLLSLSLSPCLSHPVFIYLAILLAFCLLFSAMRQLLSDIEKLGCSCQTRAPKPIAVSCVCIGAQRREKLEEIVDRRPTYTHKKRNSILSYRIEKDKHRKMRITFRFWREESLISFEDQPDSSLESDPRSPRIEGSVAKVKTVAIEVHTKVDCNSWKKETQDRRVPFWISCLREMTRWPV